MAVAIKCDRCGMCFDPLGVGNDFFVKFRNPIFQNADDKKRGNISYFLVAGLTDTFVELCPKCTIEFERFMKKE